MTKSSKNLNQEYSSSKKLKLYYLYLPIDNKISKINQSNPIWKIGFNFIDDAASPCNEVPL
jgi:hypothetical protein